MSTTMTTTSLGTSNLRGSSSRQTRNLPARTSRNVRPNLRQNSLISNPTHTSIQGASQPEPEPHGFYPAITHFTDAITALPRDFRRHTSLLKEVDAKAWALEENLQKLLKECLAERQARPPTSATHTVAGSNSSVAGDIPMGSVAGSVNGTLMDTASQYSATGIEPETMRRRRLYAELRSNLMQMIMPLDEKNHVINNANDELSRHIRRQDEIWPHIYDEISEETRLGSLRHWALTDLNPTKKTQIAAGRAVLQENEVAERSSSRREAMLAKSKKTAQHVDSDVEARKVNKKGLGKKQLDVEEVAAGSSVNQIGTLPGVKVKKGRTAAQKKTEEHPEKLGLLTIAAVGMPISRENSQQDNSKKRKAPTGAITVARKRINAAVPGSPKLGQSPLANDSHKKSPALSSAKLANGRARQNSAQSGESSNRPASSAARRNGVTATGSDLERVAVTTGKTQNEVKHTMRETHTSRGEKMLEEDVPASEPNRIRGGIALERTGSKQSQLRKEDETVGRRTASPRLNAAAFADAKSERNGKSKANKSAVLTPTVGTFAEAESESAAEAASTAEYGTEKDAAGKLKRPARPRMKDHHGLHDSLSPKGLPTKRTHKRNQSYSLSQSFSARSVKDEETASSTTERKTTGSRANSRSAKDTDVRGGRNASQTPKIGGQASELVDEPESLPSANSDDAATAGSKTMSRRQSRNPALNNSGSNGISNSNNQSHQSPATTTFDVKPPPSSRTAIYPSAHSVKSSTNTPGQSPALRPQTHAHSHAHTADHSPLGSPGPDIPTSPAPAHSPSRSPSASRSPTPSASGSASPSVSRSPSPPPVSPPQPPHPTDPPNASPSPTASEAEEENDDPDDPNETRYCYCNGVSYGEMVACDNDNCAREWFHLECTGLRALPVGRVKWFCEECKRGRV